MHVYIIVFTYYNFSLLYSRLLRRKNMRLLIDLRYRENTCGRELKHFIRDIRKEENIARREIDVLAARVCTISPRRELLSRETPYA